MLKLKEFVLYSYMLILHQYCVLKNILLEVLLLKVIHYKNKCLSHPHILQKALIGLDD